LPESLLINVANVQHRFVVSTTYSHIFQRDLPDFLYCSFRLRPLFFIDLFRAISLKEEKILKKG